MSNEDLARTRPVSVASETHSETPSRRTFRDVCPYGLDALINLDTVVICQGIELAELVCCKCETCNIYSVKNKSGREIWQIRELTGCLTRLCCGVDRAFTAVMDDFDGHYTTMERSCRCCKCYFPGCLNTVSVTSASGDYLGCVKELWSLCCNTNFGVKDSNGDTVLKIYGPCFTTSCCCSAVDFSVCTVAEGVEIGKVSKQWGGILKEMYTDADTFIVTFPVELDVKIKMLLIAAGILIDFMFFESTPESKKKKEKK